MQTFYCLISLLLMFSCGRKEVSHATWSVYRGDPGNTAYSLHQINRKNVNQLEVAWTYHTGDAEAGDRSTIQCNPIIVNGMMYITSPKLKLIALDPITGKEIWKFDPFDGRQAVGVNRGVTYWQGGEDKRIFFAARSYLYGLNVDNGELIAGFGTTGKVAAGGGGKVGSPSGDAYVAFALPGF